MKWTIRIMLLLILGLVGFRYYVENYFNDENKIKISEEYAFNLYAKSKKNDFTRSLSKKDLFKIKKMISDKESFVKYLSTINLNENKKLPEILKKKQILHINLLKTAINTDTLNNINNKAIEIVKNDPLNTILRELEYQYSFNKALESEFDFNKDNVKFLGVLSLIYTSLRNSIREVYTIYERKSGVYKPHILDYKTFTDIVNSEKEALMIEK